MGLWIEGSTFTCYLSDRSALVAGADLCSPCVHQFHIPPAVAFVTPHTTDCHDAGCRGAGAGGLRDSAIDGPSWRASLCAVERPRYRESRARRAWDSSMPSSFETSINV